ncbi:MAG: CHAD domain-containing protein [Acidobacteria bacterium]|nr:CHAD domain-containing protein [Acidobacteriota bacterium]
MFTPPAWSSSRPFSMPIDQQRTRSLFLKLNRLLSRVPAHPTPEAVHQLRTTTRRVEALLETLSSDADRNQRRLARSLKRVRRRAGRIRDLDVHQAALRSLKIGRDSTRKQQLMNQLAERRSRQERKLLKRLDAASIGDLRKRLRRAAQQVLRPANGRRRAKAAATNPDHRPRPVEEPLAQALRLFAKLARETGPLTDANLHQFRTRCKRVRYVAEMGGDTREIQNVVKEFKRLQDAVGIWHDWLTLTRTADQLFAGASDSALLNALQNITRAKFVEALRTASDVKRNLLAIRVPVPRPARARKLPKPRAASHPVVRKAARPAKGKVARKSVPVPAESSAEPQPQPEQPEAPPAKPSQPEASPEPETSKASA